MSKKLLAWEEYSKQNFPDSGFSGEFIYYWRRCDQNGKEVLTLTPEQMTSQIWYWEFNENRFNGSYDNFESAKNDADKKAQEFGYTI